MFHKIYSSTRIQLPYEVIDCIYENCNSKILMSMTNIRYKNKFFHENKMANKLQTWYRKQLLVDWEKWSKKRIVRTYYSNYEWQFLKKYPTFLIKKCNKPELRLKAYEAEEIGTRKSIIKFLELEEVTKTDIIYAGW